MNIPPFAAIITAAGASERFNRGREEKVKKEYLSIDGHTILYRATEPFLEIPSLRAVVVTCPKGSEDETAVALEDLVNINGIPFLIVEGGDTRTESVKNALNALRNLPFGFEYIAIHDGARPFVKPELIIQTLATASIAGASAPVMRINDAVKRIGANGLIVENVDRTNLVRVQTPQIFKADWIFDSYERISDDESFADDIEVLINAGYSCSCVQGDESNSKITYFKDISDADKQIEEYLEARDKGRHSADAVRRMRELMKQREEEI